MPHHIVVSGKYSHPSHPFVCILDRGSTASFLACVSNFLQLASIQLLIQDPTVYERPRDCNILSSTFQILSHIRSGPRLRKVDLWLNPYAIAIPSSPGRFSYNLTRTGFLDILREPQMRDVLELFPSLERFSLSLRENDRQYDARWWNDRIGERLPAFQDVLEVALDGHDRTSTSESPILPYRAIAVIFIRASSIGAVQFLWDPEGLARRLAGLRS